MLDIKISDKLRLLKYEDYLNNLGANLAFSGSNEQWEAWNALASSSGDLLEQYGEELYNAFEIYDSKSKILKKFSRAYNKKPEADSPVFFIYKGEEMTKSDFKNMVTEGRYYCDFENFANDLYETFGNRYISFGTHFGLYPCFKDFIGLDDYMYYIHDHNSNCFDDCTSFHFLDIKTPDGRGPIIDPEHTLVGFYQNGDHFKELGHGVCFYVFLKAISILEKYHFILK